MSVCVECQVQHPDLSVTAQWKFVCMLLMMPDLASAVFSIPSFSSLCSITHLFIHSCFISLSQSDIVPESFLDFHDPDT